jgi:hypothetical protein
MTQVAASGPYQVLAFSGAATLLAGDIVAGVVECSDGKVEVIVLRRARGRGRSLVPRGRET